MEDTLDSAFRSISNFVQTGREALFSLFRGNSEQPPGLELHSALADFGCLGILVPNELDNDGALQRYTPRLPKDEVVRVWLTQIIPRWRTTRTQQRCLLELGIPPLVRGRVWICAIGNEQGLKREHYAKCLQHGAQLDSAPQSRCLDIRSDGRGEIQLDVSRTRFGKLMPDPDVMRRVLNAWYFLFHRATSSNYSLQYDLVLRCSLRPDLGYVQGMSYIVMMLLTNMGEFEAFVSLGNMLQRPYFAPFIAMDVPAMSLRWRCVCVLLQREIPILNAHFISLQFSIDSCLMNWFYTLFVKDFGINVCTFVWDRFLFEGEVSVYRSCLAAFWCLREHILAEGLQGVSTIIQDPSKLVTRANFEAAYARFSSLDHQVISEALYQSNVTSFNSQQQASSTPLDTYPLLCS